MEVIFYKGNIRCSTQTMGLEVLDGLGIALLCKLELDFPNMVIIVQLQIHQRTVPLFIKIVLFIFD